MIINTINTNNKMDSDKILLYWFGNSNKYNSKKWFIESYKYDEEIKENFETMLHLYNNKKGYENLLTKNNFIAYIILLDQFSRQIYRNTNKAFQYDRKIIEFTDIGFEYYLNDFTDMEILFAFMPYIHSEIKHYREKGKQLLIKIDEKMKKTPEENEKIYMKIKRNFDSHEELYNRFGRFPKRNIVLNRSSTQEEIDYIENRQNNYF